MKKSLVLSFLFLSCFMYSQNTESHFDKLVSFEFSMGFKSYLGNNFIAKTYNNSFPVATGSSVNIYRKLGVGFYFKKNSASLETTQYVGNSAKGTFIEWGFYACYYAQLNKKWLFIPKIGIATFNLKNELYPYLYSSKKTYYTTGTTYFIAPEINYFLHNNISLFSSIGYGIIDLSKVKASSSLDTNYTSSNQLDLEVGLRFWFGKK
jgi:hypothetical protein